MEIGRDLAHFCDPQRHTRTHAFARTILARRSDRKGIWRGARSPFRYTQTHTHTHSRVSNTRTGAPQAHTKSPHKQETPPHTGTLDSRATFTLKIYTAVNTKKEKHTSKTHAHTGCKAVLDRKKQPPKEWFHRLSPSHRLHDFVATSVVARGSIGVAELFCPFSSGGWLAELCRSWKLLLATDPRAKRCPDSRIAHNYTFTIHCWREAHKYRRRRDYTEVTRGETGDWRLPRCGTVGFEHCASAATSSGMKTNDHPPSQKKTS